MKTGKFLTLTGLLVLAACNSSTSGNAPTGNNQATLADVTAQNNQTGGAPNNAASPATQTATDTAAAAGTATPSGGASAGAGNGAANDACGASRYANLVGQPVSATKTLKIPGDSRYYGIKEPTATNNPKRLNFIVSTDNVVEAYTKEGATIVRVFCG